MGGSRIMFKQKVEGFHKQINHWRKDKPQGIWAVIRLYKGQLVLASLETLLMTMMMDVKNSINS